MDISSDGRQILTGDTDWGGVGFDSARRRKISLRWVELWLWPVFENRLKGTKLVVSGAFVTFIVRQTGT